MERTLILTKDGSHSISVPALDATYHSLHGAIQESIHVCIDAGLLPVLHSNAAQPTRVFEMGLGTGLNALLTLEQAEKQKRPICYTAIELYPLEPEQTAALNYCEQIQRPDLAVFFQQLHRCQWELEVQISPYFSLIKHRIDLRKFSARAAGNQLIYYDAFAPATQPELWTTTVFEKLLSLLGPGGLLVTYCSKSVVRKAMLAAGFLVEKIPGPRGKREMLRAKKKE